MYISKKKFFVCFAVPGIEARSLVGKHFTTVVMFQPLKLHHQATVPTGVGDLVGTLPLLILFD
jgi:hypothetical protein